MTESTQNRPTDDEDIANEDARHLKRLAGRVLDPDRTSAA